MRMAELIQIIQEYEYRGNECRYQTYITDGALHESNSRLIDQNKEILIGG